MNGAWTRRPATAVSRLSGRPLLLVSARVGQRLGSLARKG
jgi:hypothetical protein